MFVASCDLEKKDRRRRSKRRRQKRLWRNMPPDLEKTGAGCKQPKKVSLNANITSKSSRLMKWRAQRKQQKLSGSRQQKQLASTQTSDGRNDDDKGTRHKEDGGLGDNTPPTSKNGEANKPSKSSGGTGGATLLVLLGVAAFVAVTVFIFKLWQKKKRQEQYARLLKLFEEDDELELELGLRD
ncbi:hypothetical protein KSP40_PGU001802 [Platanthera guangdongensis]|uniref:Uncharacterized protein n=1 Tax=Platanthera guangdongensis TaxID=2320717 RepID=A0ABR2MP11_9ASPA